MLFTVSALAGYKWVIDLLYRYSFLFAVLTFLIGWVFMPYVIRIAHEKNLVVHPNKRTAHKGNIPNIGGLDIFISFLIFFVMFAYNHVANAHFVVTGLVIIWFIGFLDDLVVFKPSTKLFGELIAGVMLVVLADVRIGSLYGFLGIYELPEVVSILLSLFAYVGIVNALNLIDGVDGLASGLGILYSVCFALYFRWAGDDITSVLGFALVGALSVFFIYNVFGKSQKIFMGDSGSLMLGYMMCWFVFQLFKINETDTINSVARIQAVPAVSFTLLFIPLFDTIRVMLTRIRKHKSPFHADRNHIHHLLLRCGLKHRYVTYVLLSVSLLFVALAYCGRNWRNEWLFLASFGLGIVLVIVLWRIVDYQSTRLPDPFAELNKENEKLSDDEPQK